MALLHLGLGATHMMLLALTVVVGALTVVPGVPRCFRPCGTARTAFVFLAIGP
ncbi:hypothetical protein [Streptomyces sp. NPDC058463]|uniref:hypothetical protein n=1 Tax=Streptomyces sp. NPDC058463 TaxID=3346510 RepID=UPI00366645C3